MNQISGKVLLKETGAGIPDLLVEIYDVDPATRPEECVLAGAAAGISRPPIVSSLVSYPNLLGDRLGSVLTERTGAFALEYDDASFRRRNPDEQRPDLLLVVRAPEDMDALSNGGALHVSQDIRQGASSRETFIVRIAAARLAAAGVPTPGSRTRDEEDEPEAVIEQVRRSVSRRARVEEEVQKIATDQVVAARARVAEVERQIETRLLEKLTGVPDRVAARLNYVRPGEDVETAMFSAVRKSIEGTINRASPATGYIVLSKAQAHRFRRQSQRELALDGGGTNGAGNAVRGDGAGGVSPAAGSESQLTPVAIRELLARLTDTMTSPEEAIAFGLEPRSTPAAVDAAIGGFRLRAAPADAPAFHDFHSLHIALDRVWQKAIDEGVR